MTLAEMRTDVYELLGEPSDLDPAVSTTRLDFAINQGVKKVAMWKEPGLGQVRFRDLFASAYFKSHTEDETLAAGSTVNTLVLDASGPDNDDAYLNWTVEVGSEQVLVVDYVGSTHTAYLASDLSAAPASATAITFYQSHFLILPSSSPLSSLNITKPTGFVEILKIVDMKQNQELDMVNRTEKFTDISTGDPTEYYRFGNDIIFNYAVSDERYFELEYYRLPATLVNDTDEPELPEAFHYAVILWAIWWGYRRSEESSLAYSTKRDLVDFMRTTKTEYDVSYERKDAHGYLNTGGY